MTKGGICCRSTRIKESMRNVEIVLLMQATHDLQRICSKDIIIKYSMKTGFQFGPLHSHTHYNHSQYCMCTILSSHDSANQRRNVVSTS